MSEHYHGAYIKRMYNKNDWLLTFRHAVLSVFHLSGISLQDSELVDTCWGKNSFGHCFSYPLLKLTLCWSWYQDLNPVTQSVKVFM